MNKFHLATTALLGLAALFATTNKAHAQLTINYVNGNFTAPPHQTYFAQQDWTFTGTSGTLNLTLGVPVTAPIYDATLTFNTNQNGPGSLYSDTATYSDTINGLPQSLSQPYSGGTPGTSTARDQGHISVGSPVDYDFGALGIVEVTPLDGGNFDIPPGVSSYSVTHTVDAQFVLLAPAATPEPGSMALLVGFGVSGTGLLLRRRRVSKPGRTFSPYDK